MSAQVDQSTVETVRQITGLDGQPGLVTNRCVELATGLNRRDPQTGWWVRARDAIEAFAEGFVARQAAHQVIWLKTLDAGAGVDMWDTESKRYRRRGRGLNCFDPASGKRAMIASPAGSLLKSARNDEEPKTGNPENVFQPVGK